MNKYPQRIWKVYDVVPSVGVSELADQAMKELEDE